MKFPACRSFHPGKLIIVCAALLLPAASPVRAQQAKIDSLTTVLHRPTADTNRVNALLALADILEPALVLNLVAASQRSSDHTGTAAPAEAASAA